MKPIQNLLLCLIIAILGCQNVSNKLKETNHTSHNVSWSEIVALGQAPFDKKIQYGEKELQYGELRLPKKGKKPYPIVVFIHGGCWLSDYSLDHVTQVSASLAEQGYAVWTPEYRRVGDEGGGWTGTFEDISKGVDYLRVIKNDYEINLDNITLMGHSAGGHLALWLAARENISNSSDIYMERPLPVKAVFSLSGITDLEVYDKVENDCSVAVQQLMGGKFDDVATRYVDASPVYLLPTGTLTRLFHGDADNIVPISQSENFVKKASASGDNTTLITVKGGGHFDMVSPHSKAWSLILKELKKVKNEK